MRTTIAFIFKKENYLSNLRLNYKMDLEPAKTSSIRTTNKAGVLVMTLNKLKPNSKWIIGLPVRVA